ncbi:MAG: RsmE family RNA methyltransferase [Planctomycetaceae bacterium]
MTRRYHVAQLPASGGIVPLDEAERHHALNVMRVKVGDSITLFDGCGGETSAVIQTASKREVLCESQPVTLRDRENSVFLSLGVAMPKGDRAKELVERLTELGVNRLVPLHCQRTQWEVSENAIAKWQRVVIDACKQCGRNRLMEIASPQTLSDWLVNEVSRSQGDHYFVHPAGDGAPLPSGDAKQSCATIGPEGGFSDEEVALADSARWKRLSLGDRIYRVETAAVLAAVKIAKL